MNISGSRVSAPLSTCSDNFNTRDKNECFLIDHDQRSGKTQLYPGILIIHHCAGVVNVTVNCCIWNDLMFQKESVISANAYRCEVLVCEEKVGRMRVGWNKKYILEEWSWC